MVLVSYKLINKYRTMQTTRCKFLGLQSSDDSSTLVGVTSFAGEESRMTTVRRGARPHSNVRLTTYQKLKRTSVLTLPTPTGLSLEAGMRKAWRGHRRVMRRSDTAKR